MFKNVIIDKNFCSYLLNQFMATTKFSKNYKIFFSKSWSQVESIDNFVFIDTTFQFQDNIDRIFLDFANRHILTLENSGMGTRKNFKRIREDSLTQHNKILKGKDILKSRGLKVAHFTWNPSYTFSSGIVTV